MVTDQKVCRACGGSLLVVLNLGQLYPSVWLSDSDPIPPRRPLALSQCQECGLVQLAFNYDMDELYRTYFYQSGINPTMVAALQNVVDEAMKLVKFEPLDAVCDIACNDFTLLRLYPDTVTKVGFDPARNLPQKGKIDHFINDYFSADAYPLYVPKAKIVTSIAVFYDLPDPHQFIRDVKAILAPDGVWIIQLSDLRSMLETNSIDNTCEEHLEYYSALDIVRLCSEHGLEVFRIEHNTVNAGSLRFYIAFAGKRQIEPSVDEFLKADLDYLESPEGSMAAFAKRVGQARADLVGWLGMAKGQGQTVSALAASTKGNTLLQGFGITNQLINKIGDLNPEKIGKHTIGSNIPIVPEQEVLDDQPDYILILAWHFLPFFLDKLKPYLLKGGTVIAPLPQPTLYRMVGSELKMYLIMPEKQSGD